MSTFYFCNLPQHRQLAANACHKITQGFFVTPVEHLQPFAASSGY